ncbi:metallophosphoesterase family protein [Palleronia rufa]|uniref:metallophosphoesterase family protein n=1 Tax=Palleronia rufa TaxID=1530186 RepID=UPI0005674C9B|nr:metallophosphoesterase [Palleronia rufa]
MIRILHLSDLHFGRDRPELETPLVETVNGLAPDLVAISGDFTQRARVAQFARARAFLDRLAPPTLSVPGNHDTPLDNLLLRFVVPFRRYRRAIDPVLEPELETPDMHVVGVNTVNRFSWQRGRMSPRTIRRLSAAFARGDARLRIAVLHHPLEHGPEVEKRLMRGARHALAALRGAGADVVLSGHLHNTVTRPFAISPGCLFVQAGTGLSTRLRGEDNTFNLLSCTPGRIEVETFSAGTDATFQRDRALSFSRSAVSGWTAD